GLRRDVPELFRRLKAAGLTISLDTNDDPEDRFQDDCRQLLRHVDIFLPNRREACKIAATDNLEVAMKKLSEMVPLLVVKLGAEGAVAIRNHERTEGPALEAEVIDPVGAGDSFDAGFLHAYLEGQSLKECMSAGNAAGALCTTRAGGTEAFRDREHREKFLREHAPLLQSPPR
ncbi:MAG: carbohydrate kinase family protein, partial [Terriglobales bacterium]